MVVAGEWVGLFFCFFFATGGRGGEMDGLASTFVTVINFLHLIALDGYE